LATRLHGIHSVSASRDSDGYRTYKVKFLVEAGLTDGPSLVMLTSGLPVPGAAWNLSLASHGLSDFDLWCWFKPDMTIARHQEREGEKDRWWSVEMTATNKPAESGSRNSQRCQEIEITNPLLEPAKVSGNSVRYTEEAVRDRFGLTIVNSAWEQIRGPQVEFDVCRDTVTIEQNVAVLQAEVFGPMRNTVNSKTLWGLPRRCIKLSDTRWEKKRYGLCFFYYTRIFTFDIWVRKNPDTGLLSSGFDRELMDEATKVLNGHWDVTTGEWVLDNIAGEAPDPANPQHFIKSTDRQGNPMRMVLNGAGLPAGVISSTGYYAAIGDNFTNRDLSDPTYWVPIVGPTAIPPDYDLGSDYVRGNLITYDGAVWLVVESYPAQPPDLDPDSYVEMTSFLDQGNYSTSATYYQGNYVRDAGSATTAGSIRVEKYDESDFLFLGIPTVI